MLLKHWYSRIGMESENMNMHYLLTDFLVFLKWLAQGMPDERNFSVTSSFTSKYFPSYPLCVSHFDPLSNSQFLILVTVYCLCTYVLYLSSPIPWSSVSQTGLLSTLVQEILSLTTLNWCHYSFSFFFLSLALYV